MFCRPLQSFPSESSIQQKVLGLLVSSLLAHHSPQDPTTLTVLRRPYSAQNNIAEVGELHVELMVQGFLDHISTLLHSPEVEVSYFAAGILAHLTSRGQEAWALSGALRSSLLEQLVGTRRSTCHDVDTPTSVSDPCVCVCVSLA